MALSVMAVSTSVSPFLMDEDDTDMFMTSAPSRLPASSNEDWVRVEASKKRFTCVRPRRTVRFLSTWRLSSTYSSDRPRRPVMSAAERPSMPSKCRWPRTKVDFDVIKARAIGGDGRGGKGQCRGGGLSPDLYLVVSPSARGSVHLQHSAARHGQRSIDWDRCGLRRVRFRRTLGWTRFPGRSPMTT